MTLSIIIPAYNESKRISKTIRDIVGFLRERQIEFEIIVVPNNCVDNTEEVLIKLQNEEVPEVQIVVISNTGVRGNTKGLAISAGMKKAKGDYNIFIDADNATSFDSVIDFMSYIKNGYDIVIASRYVKGARVIKKQSLLRVILSRLSNILIRFVLLPGIYDTQCGFKMFSRKACREIFSKTTVNGWGADLEMLAIASHFGFKIKEAPVRWKSQDESNLRSNAFLNTLRELFMIRKNIKNEFYD